MRILIYECLLWLASYKFMRRHTPISLWCVLLVAAGCAARQDVTFVSEFRPTHVEHDYFFYFPEMDFTRGKSESCEIHGVQMSRQIVPVVYGTVLPSKELEAQAQFAQAHFPHAKTNCWLGCVDTGNKQARIFVCSDCKQREKDWMTSNH